MKNLFTKAIVIVLIFNFIASATIWDSMEMASAKLYFKQKNYPKALEFLKAEVSKNPTSEDGWFYMVLVYHELGEIKNLKDAFDHAVVLNPKKAKDLNQMRVVEWAKLFNKGVEDLNNAVDSIGLAKAIESFELTCYVMPESTLNFRNLALTYYRMGDYENAIPNLIIGSDNGKDNMSVKLIGDIYLEKATNFKEQFNNINQENFEKIKNLDMIREKIKSADVKYYLGQPTSINKPKGKKKIEEWSYSKYNLNLTIEDGIVTVVNNQYKPQIDSSNLYLALEYYAKAISILQKGIETFPNDAKISETLMNSFIGAERNDEARSLLETRIQKYPDSKFDHYNLGVFLLKENKFEQAIASFETSLKLDTAMSAARYNLAASYVNWGVKEQERIKKEEQIREEEELKSDKKNKNAKKEKREIDKSYLEKYKLALPYLETIVKDKPDEVPMWELLGQVYANLNDMKKADEAYKKADLIREGKK